MSAPELGQRAANGAEYAPRLQFERPKKSSSEISTGNGRINGGCADLSKLLVFDDKVLYIG